MKDLISQYGMSVLYVFAALSLLGFFGWLVAQFSSF